VVDQLHGKRLRRESLSVTFAGLDIAELSKMPLDRVAGIMRPAADGTASEMAGMSPEKALVARRLAQDLLARISVLMELGLGYLSLERSTPTLSPGELQRPRLATQVRSNIVVEHDMRVVAASDWIIDIGPGAGAEGGRVVASGTPGEVAVSPESRTAPYLANLLA
jgi:excinuclease ABC subunit A